MAISSSFTGFFEARGLAPIFPVIAYFWLPVPQYQQLFIPK